MRILVTGARGFAGSALVERLRARGHEPVACAARLEEAEAVRVAARAGAWDAVVHLAAVSRLADSERDPARTRRINVEGTRALLDAALERSPSAHVVFASSAMVYAAMTAGMPRGERLDEASLLDPGTVYGETKLAGEDLLTTASVERGARTTSLRLFNHTHRTQPADYFLPRIHAALRAARPGERVVIPTGNLDIWRDIGARSDLVSAIVTVLEQRVVGIFNVCSGVAKNLGGLAAKLAARMGVDASFEVDPARVRRDEPRWICGSHDALTRATGWRPEHASEERFLDHFLSG